MNLNYTYADLADLLDAEQTQPYKGEIKAVAYDTRKIYHAEALAFFALHSEKDNGHKYVLDAYEKGVRCFVVDERVELPDDACVLTVEDTLEALQQLAKKHREQFAYPVVAITGSYGKTMAKEWLYSLLKDDYQIVRSPKSYNSQIGVALSLLEMSHEHNLAIIEVGISEPDEMEILEDIVDPTLGIFTGIGAAHQENFESEKQHVKEKLKLFKHSNFVFAQEEYASPFRRAKINVEYPSTPAKELAKLAATPFKSTLENCLECALFLGRQPEDMEPILKQLPTVASRMEILIGKKDNVLINDTYSLDLHALEQAVNYLLSLKEKSQKIAVIDLTLSSEEEQRKIEQFIANYPIDKVYYIREEILPETLDLVENAAILFKAKRKSFIKKEIENFKEKKHDTWLEIDQSAILENINHFRSKLHPNTKLLCMVKASSYGSGDVKMAHLMESAGVDYLGVAYADEGVDLRKAGIQSPIMVMNASESAFQEIIKNELEPAIFDIPQLEAFIGSLIRFKKTNFPIHIKVETGMNRLGFSEDDLDDLFELLQAQPEVNVKSVYSHLASSDHPSSTFNHKQAKRFAQYKEVFTEKLGGGLDFHLLNSSGILNFPEYQYSMVRLGIGMYGYIEKQPGLKASLAWYTRISQIKIIQKGDTVGYGQNFTAEKEMHIATLPIGYSDGIHRVLGNGKGEFFLQGKKVHTVGNICMDMCMIDVSDIPCQKGDLVEIIGANNTIFDLAKASGTIVYELMTSISKRVERIYLQN
ncbi:UDP-N-acetylmuramoyl-tripeptide--D-alanyl-D-alanine ligase [Lishizhenia tianjinensis]|uniref:Alanine racemase n=1 Tax=Lishizhenia tianjinensis TaxID=477690 RepID=A0A1I6ZRD3_9FLAO|nr:alanine racemase [Lishizhenia tianjinensis]SFT65283.1 UDP-N-acetylmuramoyl-tripeptide--D-alanyl-D-alanine ligase [Lishizhenia tianjinensis]